MGRLEIVRKLRVLDIYHVGKRRLCGPRGPESERRSMQNSMYAVVIH
jgi:hypothetical protein